jgi:flagellar basal body-associated protein FliL
MKKRKTEIKNKTKIILIVIGAVLVVTCVILLITLLPKDNSNSIGNNNENESLPPGTNQDVKKEAVLYEPKYSFNNFTDPKEGAFTIKLPEGWEASEDSGLIRPYIDAGVKLMVTSSKNQQFLYISPYGVYAVPNDLLTFAGFTEGTNYNGMLVKSYTEAEDFLTEIVQQLDVETEIIEVIERPDLIIENPGPLITRQSAAEITYISNPGKNQLKNKIVCYIYLIEPSGIGIWASTLFGYSSSENLFNETEYLVLKSAETFRVNPQWAAREAQEMNKRLNIISSTQDSISDTISSTFEYRSESQDRINNEWSKTILGVEEVYNPETGDTRFVDSGAEYYWMDNQNRVWGTDIDENPSPQGDMTNWKLRKDKRKI